MSMNPQPLDEVDATKNVTHKQCHVMRNTPYCREILYPQYVSNGCGYHSVTSHDTA
jgi:hypothetical protein